MENGIMFQYFEWNLPNDGKLWKKLKEDAQHLYELGVTAVWIPSPCKGASQNDVGYGIYDVYDLGEFNQKGTVRTKYGTKQELKDMIDELHKCKMNVYMDTVMNHKGGADYTEKFMAQEVDSEDRTKVLTEPYEIEGWTGFEFANRNNVYSDFKWHWQHFSGVDYNAANDKKAIYKIVGNGKDWSKDVDTEKGNFDYLMNADIDYNNPEVVEEMKKWGIWVAKELRLDGMRLDALKHIDGGFIEEFLKAVRAEVGKEFYAVGEYWKNDNQTLDEFLSSLRYKTDLFDVTLHYNMCQASQNAHNYDLRQLLDDTLVKAHSTLAVTFVENHDSQAGSSLQSPVEDWFKPSAYALILLGKYGYPCVFYGDYYGIGGKESPHRLILDKLIRIRRKYAYGEQVDYFDHPTTAGFVRLGEEDMPHSGLAVLFSTGEDGYKEMNVGEHQKGEIWHEITGNVEEEVTIDEQGNGKFFVHSCKLAVWMKKIEDETVTAGEGI